MILQGVQTNIQDKYQTVLFCIYKGFTIREIAKELGKTIGTVQQVMAALKDNGLIDNEPRKASYLTPKGEEHMRKIGLIK